MEKKRGLTGSDIKLIAVVTMLIDHIGAVILERYLVNSAGFGTVLNSGLELMTSGQFSDGVAVFTSYEHRYLALLYFIMRLIIGRIAFPIFCFTLVEGFAHTHNRMKYIATMTVFALVAELPFNLAIAGSILSFDYQNVMFTMLIGLLTMWLIEFIVGKIENWHFVFKLIIKFVIIIAMAVIAELLKVDYGAIGIITIAIIYNLRIGKTGKTAVACAFLSLATISELGTFLSLPFVALYNGERGMKMKYFFYVFYPAHLLILFFIAKAMKLV